MVLISSGSIDEARRRAATTAIISNAQSPRVWLLQQLLNQPGCDSLPLRFSCHEQISDGVFLCHPEL